MSKITVQDLLSAGVHFGHQTKRWNPKMSEYVYGVKNGIYIIDLAKTMHQLAGACNFLQHTITNGGNILFVGTKRQAQEVVKEAAEKTDSFYITGRWLGGTLTNNTTIQRSVSRMQEIDKQLEGSESSAMKKKEISSLTRQGNKLHRNFDGIWKMKKLPSALVVVDVCHEHIAVAEASKLGIPIVAIVDTNANPDKVGHPIVANDDAVKSISVIVKVLGDAIKTASELYQKKVIEDRAAKEAEKAKEKEEREKAQQAAEKAKKEAKAEQSKKAEKSAEKSKEADKKKEPAAKKEEKAPAEKDKKEEKAVETKKNDKTPVAEEKKEAKKEPKKTAVKKADKTEDKKESSK
jgi:small subunit ribosomal protein S2